MRQVNHLQKINNNVLRISYLQETTLIRRLTTTLFEISIISRLLFDKKKTFVVAIVKPQLEGAATRNIAGKEIIQELFECMAQRST